MAVLEGHPGLDKTLALCLGAAFAALVLLPSTRLFDPKAVAALVLAALLCLGAALALSSGAARDWALPRPGLLLLWVLAALVFGAALAVSPYRREVGFEELSLPAAAVLSLGLAAAPRVWGRSLLQAWRWALLLLALYALCQRLGWEPMPAYADAGSRVRAMGSFGNATYCAAFLCLSWPLLLAWNGRPRMAALTLVFAALLATQGRAALLAVLAQVGVLLFSWGRARRNRRASAALPGAGARPSGLRVWLPGLLLALALAAFLLAFLFPFSQWFRPTLRWPLWQASVDLWAQRPWLGWGPGAFAVAFQDHAPAALRALVNAGNAYAEAPHQLLLGLACSAGLVGLAAFAAVSVFFVRLLAVSPLAEAPALGLGALGLLLESQADRFFFSPGLFVPLAAALGLLAWRAEAATEKSGAGKASAASRTSLAWVCMALTFVFAWTGILTLLHSRQGLGASLDSGVGALAVAGDPRTLAARAKAEPDDAQTLERLGDALAAQHQYEAAAKALERALALQPSAGSAQNLGNCYMMLGQAAQAEGAFRRAVRLAPDNSDAHFSLGYALYYEKRLKESLLELDTALRLDPSNAGATQLKRQILR